MTSRKENALGLYREGILEGHPREAVERYTGARYTQHSTGVADGKEGFVAFFEPFLARNPVREFDFLRALEDGQYVFLHAHQRINGGESEWITMDLFDTDAEGKIIEHWDVIVAPQPANASGHSQIDGPRDVTDQHLTDEHRRLVAAFVDDGLIGAQHDRIPEWVAEDYVEHAADRSDGRQKLLAWLAAPEHPLVYEARVLTVAEGNFVATLCRASRHGVPHCQVDLYRLQDGLIVEHWESAEPVPPEGEWANSGKF
ncbi:MAG: nuclear transport factor 2 family protein [Pseudomonadota bacterium]